MQLGTFSLDLFLLQLIITIKIILKITEGLIELYSLNIYPHFTYTDISKRVKIWEYSPFN